MSITVSCESSQSAHIPRTQSPEGYGDLPHARFATITVPGDGTQNPCAPRDTRPEDHVALAAQGLAANHSTPQNNARPSYTNCLEPEGHGQLVHKESALLAEPSDWREALMHPVPNSPKAIGTRPITASRQSQVGPEPRDHPWADTCW